jgi:hypothetical protein
MKHASAGCLDRREELLQRFRGIFVLREKQRGIFYRKRKAFTHFHEDPAGRFADLRPLGDWRRMPVNTAAERLLEAAKQAIE